MQLVRKDDRAQVRCTKAQGPHAALVAVGRQAKPIRDTLDLTDKHITSSTEAPT